MNELKELLKKKIIWEKMQSEGIDFFAIVNGKEYKLIIGDFPDEDLFSLENNTEKYTFNDTPELWTIPWDED